MKHNAERLVSTGLVWQGKHAMGDPQVIPNKIPNKKVPHPTTLKPSTPPLGNRKVSAVHPTPPHGATLTFSISYYLSPPPSHSHFHRNCLPIPLPSPSCLFVLLRVYGRKHQAIVSLNLDVSTPSLVCTPGTDSIQPRTSIMYTVSTFGQPTLPSRLHGRTLQRGSSRVATRVLQHPPSSTDVCGVCVAIVMNIHTLRSDRDGDPLQALYNEEVVEAAAAAGVSLDADHDLRFLSTDAQVCVTMMSA